ncbi:MAG: aldo/keto reductase [Dorea sp.]|jgi:predicted aldo/keto reductase-like oxidoreductase|nr:aldo/keto reductase [Dorea sp.]
MQYRNDRYGNPISLLGFGCMRFTKKGNSIDIDKAEREVMEAIRGGVNYLDTAYIYPGSEAAVGEILKRTHCREQISIATKLPQYYIKSKNAVDKYFEEQLKRLQTDYIDYYLMHMLTDVTAWNKLKDLGIVEWIDKKKQEGSIRNLGFSYHGNTEMFLQILNAYDWDFCQIQYNYMDEHTQAGRAGLLAAAEKGVPVIIMEPLRGGKLVDLLPERAKKLIAEYPKKRTPAEWAFRWLWEQPEVTCVLSGMNSIDMVEENIRIASEVETGEFTEEDKKLIEQIRQEIQGTLRVGCTGCGYCMPCPKGIDIPAAFRCYNHMYTEGKGSGRHEYLQTVCLQKDFTEPGSCIECGKCEKICPQGLEIRKELKEADKELLPFYYRIGLKIIKKLGFLG